MMQDNHFYCGSEPFQNHDFLFCQNYPWNFGYVRHKLEAIETIVDNYQPVYRPIFPDSQSTGGILIEPLQQAAAGGVNGVRIDTEVTISNLQEFLQDSRICGHFTADFNLFT